MSGNVSSPAPKAGAESTPSPRKATQTPQKASSREDGGSGADPSVPRTVRDESHEPQLGQESQNNNDDGEGEMVPAAGRIKEDGEVVDDDGNVIGRVVSGSGTDPKDLVGYIVTQEGDVLDHDGGVVGKAEPLEDDHDNDDNASSSEPNYTTTAAKGSGGGGGGQKEQEGGGGGGRGLGGTLWGAGNAAKTALGGATGAAGDTARGATEAVGDTAKGATDAAGKATGTESATDNVGDTTKGATDTAGDAAKGVTDTAEAVTGDVQDKAEDTTSQAQDQAEGAKDTTADATEGAADTVDDATKETTDTPEGVTGGTQGKTGDIASEAQDKTEGAKEATEGAAGEVQDTAGEEAPIDLQDKAGEPQSRFGSKAEGLAEEASIPVEGVPSLPPSVADKVIGLFEGPFTIADGGKVTDKDGKVLGQLAVGSDIQDLIGKEVKGIDREGNLLDQDDNVLGKVNIAPEGSVAQKVKKQVPEAAERLNALQKARQDTGIKIPSFAPSVADRVVAMFEGPFNIAEDGQVTDQNGKILGKLAEGQDYQHLIGKDIKGIDGKGNLLGDNDTILGKVNLVPEGSIAERIKEEIPEARERLEAIEEAKAQEQETGLPDVSILAGLKINEGGNVVDENGNPLGRVKSSDIKKLVGKTPDKNGKVWDNQGNVIGEVEVLPEAIKNEAAPFEDFPDAIVDKSGKVIYEGRQVGVVVGDDFQKLIGKKVDPDGDILDKHGNVIGHAERQEAEEPAEPEGEAIDYSILRDKKVNKLGNVVDDKGQVWGHVVQGVLKHLVGKKVGPDGQIFNDAGQVIGKAEPIPESEREEVSEPAPFEDFPGAVVDQDGKVMFQGQQVGILVEGDAKKLKGKAVDADGDILDRAGNRLGRAERWDEPEEPEPEIDNSALAGKRVNKAGNVVDKHGDIYGRIVEGKLSRLVGKMCDKQGFIRNEGGDIIGKAQVIPEAEREGLKEGPFSEFQGCTVTREGKVVTPGGDVVGRLVSGDPKVLVGRPVDDDGDVVDKNGNAIGHAERWEEPEEEKDVSPMCGRRVNKQGEVVDENGDVMGKLTSGSLGQCIGKKIDEDGDVVDGKGNKLGHCSLPSEIPEPEPEPEPTETEEKQARLQLEQDRKIAGQIANCIEQSLDKIRPILRMTTTKIEAEERKPEDERDEEQLVKDVCPLIEEGGKILTEANGVIRGLDPDGRISANAKHKTAAREATPEEYRLAELLKELTGNVTETIENAKRKLENMPRAKKQINPLWGLLAEPLFQILAAVGLLLSGVLGLVGKLLNGLGLGGLVNNLLGGLGLTKVLEGLGLDDVLGLGGSGGKKKSGGGLLGIF
ncbi:hypothetical protein DL766_004746 [Monosporascus sp. MC13-8B]|uniref:DUF6987 domain-containing protein n=1 Tax=Monosporascus cannonballus TaxID=155416 RepID=A0ABY0H1E8_9PEZI|nr:hypothetical protein DL762_006647 [Monosporascus cannonballus]RYO88478.1 hypothetical protein DL763_005977 [Monosporascus cannonballus]RYP30734.1 hypothetical protein DL766_004746 [Monosporascus sp. MC13-8B]